MNYNNRWSRISGRGPGKNHGGGIRLRPKPGDGGAGVGKRGSVSEDGADLQQRTAGAVGAFVGAHRLKGRPRHIPGGGNSRKNREKLISCLPAAPAPDAPGRGGGLPGAGTRGEGGGQGGGQDSRNRRGCVDGRALSSRLPCFMSGHIGMDNSSCPRRSPGASASATAEPPHFVGSPAPPGRAPLGIRCPGLRGPRPAIAAWLTGRSAAGRTSFLPGGCAPRGGALTASRNTIGFLVFVKSLFNSMCIPKKAGTT